MNSNARLGLLMGFFVVAGGLLVWMLYGEAPVDDTSPPPPPAETRQADEPVMDPQAPSPQPPPHALAEPAEPVERPRGPTGIVRKKLAGIESCGA